MPLLFRCGGFGGVVWWECECVNVGMIMVVVMVVVVGDCGGEVGGLFALWYGCMVSWGVIILCQRVEVGGVPRVMGSHSEFWLIRKPQ